jgi:hypothetical protein
MIPAFRLKEVTEELRHSFKVNPSWNNRLIGFVFCRPELALAKANIIPQLDYYHHRSGVNTDFFFAGYGKYQEGLTQEIPDPIEVTSGRKINWLFSLDGFNEFRIQLENNSKWSYSGSIDLLLCNASRQQEDNGFIDFSNLFYCDLEKMITNRAIISVERFFESIFKYAESPAGTNPAADFVVNRDVESIKNIFGKIINGLLHKLTGTELTGIRNSFIKNVANNAL